METEIKRINHFDGLFLKQTEFQTEQLYHQHMRRRVHYTLFGGSGVVQVEPADLRIVPTAPPVDKTFRVSPGMALSHRSDLVEAREILLRAQTDPIDLSTFGFAQAFVAIHYEEQLIEPQVGTTPNTETRVKEVAVVSVHDAANPWPPAPAPPDGEQYVLLGVVTLSDMSVDESQRQTATLRPGLLGATPTPPSPSLSTISPLSVGVGSLPISVQITGTLLSGATLDVGTELVASGVTVTPTTIDFTLSEGVSLTAGTKTFTVQVGAVVLSIGFTIQAGASPNIASLSPSTQISGGTLDIRGTNLHDPLLPFNGPATGTTVTFSANGVTVQVPVVTVRNPVAFPGQIVRVAVPPPDGTWSPTQTTTVELTFNAQSGTIPFTYSV